MIRPTFLFLAVLATSACGQSDAVAPSNIAVPELESLSDAPNDWSSLSGAIGRPPGESDLFSASAISTDLNALLGPDVTAFRQSMVDAGPLRRGPDDVLVTRSESGAGWVVIQPQEHAMAAGFRVGKDWKVRRTPGSEVPIPPDLRTE
jgi:hypothetical protein